jgi:hypothetical protein
MVNKDSLFYRSADAFMPHDTRKKLEKWIVSGEDWYINYWSLIHMLTGYIYGILLRKKLKNFQYYLYAFIIHSIWEYWQIYVGNTIVKNHKIGQNDVIIDTIFFMFGVFLAKF